MIARKYTIAFELSIVYEVFIPCIHIGLIISLSD